MQAAREEYDAELARLVLQDEPELVVCLGFMHVLSTRFLGPLQEKKLRIINLHPALPGAFNGTVSFVLCFVLSSAGFWIWFWICFGEWVVLIHGLWVDRMRLSAHMLHG